MTLLTKQIISKFEKHPIHSQDGKGMDAEVLVKYFNPCGSGTWLITEAEREGDDWRLFGYCHIHEWEWATGCSPSWHIFVCRSDLPSNATFTRPGNTSGIFYRRMNDGKGLGILLPLADNRIITQKRL